MFVLALLHVDPGFRGSEMIGKWKEQVRGILPDELSQWFVDEDGPLVYGLLPDRGAGEQGFLTRFVRIGQDSLRPPGRPEGALVGCVLHDGEEQKASPDFQHAWNGFLRLYNFFQFLPGALFVTKCGVEANEYEHIDISCIWPSGAEGIGEALPQSEEWKEVREFTDEYIHPLLDWLEENDWPVPEPGYELEGKGGEILGSAELAWDELELALLTREEEMYQESFSRAGWQSLLIDKAMNEPECLVKYR